MEWQYISVQRDQGSQLNLGHCFILWTERSRPEICYKKYLIAQLEIILELCAFGVENGIL